MMTPDEAFEQISEEMDKISDSIYIRLPRGQVTALLAGYEAHAIPTQSDYICAVRHYDKYDSRYTFALPSQWYALKFSTFEDYQEFQMQLVYLLGEARKKWESRKRGPETGGEVKL